MVILMGKGPTEAKYGLIGWKGLKPIFHLKTGLRWVPDANEIYTKNMKCTCPTPAFCVGTQRNLYSTGWRRGIVSGKTQISALGNAKIYQYVGISNAKFWGQGHCPTPAPDARYFAFWWNIGLTFKFGNIQFLNHFFNFYILEVDISITALYPFLNF